MTLSNVAYQPNSNKLLSLGKLNLQGLHVDTENYVLYRRLPDATRHDYKIKPTNGHMLLLEAHIIHPRGDIQPPLVSFPDIHHVNQIGTGAQTRSNTQHEHTIPTEDYKLNTDIFTEMN